MANDYLPKPDSEKFMKSILGNNKPKTDEGRGREYEKDIREFHFPLHREARKRAKRARLADGG